MKIHAKVLFNKVLDLKQSQLQHKQSQLPFLKLKTRIIIIIHTDNETPIAMAAISPPVNLRVYYIEFNHCG